MHSEESVRTKILDLIRQAPSQRINGASLGALLRHQLVGFRPTDFNKTLKEFISTTLPQVHIKSVGNAVIYSLDEIVEPALGPATSDQASKQVEEPSVSSIATAWLPRDFWYAFTTSGSKKAIHVHTVTGQAKLEKRGAEPLPGWTLIQPLTASAHRDIATRFSPNIPETDRARIDGYIGAEIGWWRRHFEALRALGVEEDYRKFHSDEVLKQLSRTIKEQLGSGVKMWISKNSTKDDDNTETAPPNGSLDTKRFAVPNVRDLAVRVVQNMSMAELRRIRVTLGDVLDSLSNSGA